MNAKEPLPMHMIYETEGEIVREVSHQVRAPGPRHAVLAHLLAHGEMPDVVRWPGHEDVEVVGLCLLCETVILEGDDYTEGGPGPRCTGCTPRDEGR